jgi:hypothetical protein
MTQFSFIHTRKMMKTEAYIQDKPENIEQLEQSLGIQSAHKSPLLLTIVGQMFGEEEEISEDIQADSDSSSDEKKDFLVESAGTSHAPDQSVSSLAMDEFDFVEVIRRKD